MNVAATLISKVTERAVKDADEAACTTTLVEGAVRRYADNPEFWRDETFFPCLTILQQADAHEWVVRSWYPPGRDSLFANLTANQSRAVLDAMVSVRPHWLQG